MKKYLFLLAISIITFDFVHAQTNVSGGIYSNTTWTLANSPYIVTDTVVVFPGITLTIQPGVVVKFDNANQIEVRQARIIALGTATDSITFTSNAASPSAGIYAGIWLNGGNSVSKFKYVNLKYSHDGIQNNTTGYGFDIKHCKIDFNVDGISGGGLGNNSVLDSSIIENNTGWAIGEFDTIKNCRISKNLRGVMDGFTIINCAVDSNTERGIYENTGAILNCKIRGNGIGIYHGNPLTINNCVINNNQTGIETAIHDSIMNCLIDSNGIGINNGLNYNCQDNYVYNNKIKFNGVGFLDKTTTFGTSIITKNYIENDSIGIDLRLPDNFFCNKICNNTSYALKYTGANNTICMHANYWCTLDSATIENEIYDGYDNVNYGLITWLPGDSSCFFTATAISEFGKNNRAVIYPNPADNQITIENIPEANCNLIITNVLGEIVFSTVPKNKTAVINTSGFSPGIYFVNIINENGERETAKFIRK